MNKPKTLTDKKYPTFIRDNAVIKKFGAVTKSFKEVGLSDNTAKYTHECLFTVEKFVPLLKTCLNQFSGIIANYLYGYPCFTATVQDTLKSELAKLVSKITVTSIKKGIKLILPCEVKIPNFYRNKSVTYENGSSLITLLNSLCQDIDDNVYAPKINNRYNRLIDRAVDLELSWNKRLKIVFSTHPWDIATMSMRGISSCQAWGKRQSPCLVGSIVDPNMGIMYLSDGVAHKTYGERMLARSVVRLVMPSKKVDKKGVYVDASDIEKSKRGFLLEPAYAFATSGQSQSKVYNDIFLDVLCDISSKKLISTNRQLEKYYLGIPLTPEVKKTPEQFRSYRDSGIMYVPTIN